MSQAEPTDISEVLSRHYVEGTTVSDTVAETGLPRRIVERAFRRLYAKGAKRPPVRFNYARARVAPQYRGPEVIGQAIPNESKS